MPPGVPGGILVEAVRFGLGGWLFGFGKVCSSRRAIVPWAGCLVARVSACAWRPVHCKGSDVSEVGSDGDVIDLTCGGIDGGAKIQAVGLAAVVAVIIGRPISQGIDGATGIERNSWI